MSSKSASAQTSNRVWTRTALAVEFEPLVKRYQDHLVHERGLASPTVAGYQTVARQFLAHVATSGDSDLSNLTTTEVSQFVVVTAQRRCIGSTKHMVTGLRSLLRYAHLAGLTPALAGSVPKVAGCRGSALPRALPPGQLLQLVASCDLDTADGRHDRAVLLLLARLGLRAGEVVRLQLSDFDWRRGEVVIRGKAVRHERLPLPEEVGDAIAGYLLGGTRLDRSGPLFLSRGGLARPLTVKRLRAVVHDACRRAGIPPVSTHALRHTAATEMLRAGASLIEVGQVLRHRSLSTTAIYAKVDREPLRGLARRWPVTER